MPVFPSFVFVQYSRNVSDKSRAAGPTTAMLRSNHVRCFPSSIVDPMNIGIGNVVSGDPTTTARFRADHHLAMLDSILALAEKPCTVIL
jgi:hypothetical protein